MRIKRLVLVIAAVLILLPGIAGVAGFGNLYAIEENRNRKQLPGAEEVREQGYAAINDWFNDNFGLRDILIRLQHQIDYSVFKYSKTLYFSEIEGKEYLHYKSVVAEEQLYNETMSEETQDRILGVYREIKETLEERSIDFKFLIPPQKNEVLEGADRQLPIIRPEYNRYYKMQDIFENSDLAVNYVNVIGILKESNAIAPVFYQTDFHWNDFGAAVAFGKVINAYAEDLGMNEVYSCEDFDFLTFQPGYNNAQLASLSVLMYDIPFETTVNRRLEYHSNIVQDEAYPDYVVWENPSVSVFEKAVLFIGDSYTPPALYSYNGTSSGIVELFPKVYFCHWNYAKGALRNLPEDVGLVVVEAIESNYFYLDSKVGVLLEQ